MRKAELRKFRGRMIQAEATAGAKAQDGNEEGLFRK